MDKYQKLRYALSQNPTPGPWKWWEYEDLGYCCVNPLDGGLLIAKCDVRNPFDQEQRANAALIAACDPDTIRELLDERDALAAENTRLRRGAHPAITHCDNCGCDWLDNGLNPVGCPYCELRREVERWEHIEGEQQ